MHRVMVVADCFALDSKGVVLTGNQDADVARYMVWQPHAALESTRDFIAGCVSHWNAGSAFPYIITLQASGQLVGMLDARPRGQIRPW